MWKYNISLVKHYEIELVKVTVTSELYMHVRN